MLAESAGGGNGYPAFADQIPVNKSFSDRLFRRIPAYREANTGFFWRTLEKILNLKRNPIQEDPNSEYNSVSTAVQQVSAAPSFPNMPLLVISGSKNLPFVPRKAFDHHRKMQDELANLVPQATHLKAEKSSHFQQLSEPKFVADAIVAFVRSMDKLRNLEQFSAF